MVVEKLDRYMQRNEARTPSSTRINSKWIKDLTVRSEIIKIVGKNISSKILNIAHSNILLAIAPQARGKKGPHQTKTFCTAKKNINKIKRQPTEWENIFTNTSNKGLISKIYKELTKLNTKKQTT